MKRRWGKTAAAVILAFGGSYFLTNLLFHQRAPLIRTDFVPRTRVWFAGIKNSVSGLGLVGSGAGEVESESGLPPAWYFRPEEGEDSSEDANSVSPTERQKPVYPSTDPYPTHDPERRITPIRGDGGSKVVYPTTKAYPTYNPGRRVILPTIPDSGGGGGQIEPTNEPIFEPPTQVPTQPPGNSPGTQASKLLNLINQQRAKEGAGPLVFNNALNSAAQKHAKTTEGCGHYGPDGSSPFDRATEAGYPTPWVGENIACRVNSAQRAFDLWMGSPGHHSIMVDKSYKSAGIGIARGYWVFVGGPV